jgi:hypothetical protein
MVSFGEQTWITFTKPVQSCILATIGTATAEQGIESRVASGQERLVHRCTPVIRFLADPGSYSLNAGRELIEIALQSSQDENSGVTTEISLTQ